MFGTTDGYSARTVYNSDEVRAWHSSAGVSNVVQPNGQGCGAAGVKQGQAQLNTVVLAQVKKLWCSRSKSQSGAVCIMVPAVQPKHDAQQLAMMWQTISQLGACPMPVGARLLLRLCKQTRLGY